MARYLETAAKARTLSVEILEMVPAELRPVMAEHLARLYNLGIRTSPRAVHSTVRYNAVVAAMRGLPVSVKMKQVPKGNGKPGYFNALETIAKVPAAVPHVEGDDNEEE